MPKHSDFSGTNAAGRKYSKKPSTRRTPRRDKQVARGKGNPGSEPDFVKSARRDMGHGRTRKDWGQ